ncbi:MAG: hypothetical protein VB934_17820, partial [Polyangiaceae bacterium]
GFLAKVDAGGSHIWNRSFGSTGSDDANSVAIDANGFVYVLGAYQDTINFGAGDLTSAGDKDVFLVKYAP